MRLFLSMFVPWILFFTIGRPIAGFVCLVLQVTVIGWIPAAIWAVHALGQFKTDKKIGAMERKLEKDAQETAEGAGADSAEAPDRAEPGP